MGSSLSFRLWRQPKAKGKRGLREARPIDEGDGKRRVLLSSPMVMSREEKGPPFDWVKERQVLFPKMEETSPPFDWVKERRAPNFYV